MSNLVICSYKISDVHNETFMNNCPEPTYHIKTPRPPNKEESKYLSGLEDSWSTIRHLSVTIVFTRTGVAVP